MSLRRLALVAVAFVAGCSERGPEPTHRGTYVGGQGAQELNAFTPCGDTAMLWVDGMPPTIERLRKAHESMTGSLFQPIYIEVRGSDVPGGPRLDPMYTGILHIDTVLIQSGRAPMACAPKFKPFDPSDIG